MSEPTCTTLDNLDNLDSLNASLMGRTGIGTGFGSGDISGVEADRVSVMSFASATSCLCV